MNEGTRIPSSGNHEKNCEAIYWKHHTSHHITKNFTQYPLKHSFLIKIPFLLKTSKIPYYNTEDDILWYFITPLTENTCSVYRIPPQNTPRKTENRNRKQQDEKIINHKIPSRYFYFYNFHNPTHTPSQKLISITNINNIKINSIKFIKHIYKINL